ncbi:acetyltransferase (GNAT) domain protein [Leptospira broomii serovar Hurstbridge str. 5399]|uniref:Acetyltransferase (GNAT) domain protein n=1 Tax=Leptospira broomii serovar Hurstbridge str. 5399 TaxID=1049789 RepID=T0F9C3_9LEPT|nr:GNAT family N-acetyltransferase [Leptospira broomii]EQA44506.1 acetyltransferase (GNAT) domain protein [Leptospira broomii serovar Hurstbridge str. 5399]
MPFPTSIQTEHLLLRTWNDGDRDSLFKLNSDPKVMEFFPTLLSATESTEAFGRIQKHWNRYGFGLFAVEDLIEKSFIGFVGIVHVDFDCFFTPSVEIGWRLLPDFWGKGYASEAAISTLKYGFQELNVTEIVSFTSVLNDRSKSVMKKIGMEFITEFPHPNLPMSHRLSKHVLYKKVK